jgi:hypothetical protein
MQVYGNVARESALDTSGLQAKYLAQGFDAATAAAKAQAELNLNASKTLGDLSGRAYEQGVGGLDVMSKLGAQQQAQEQAQLDYPMSALTKSSNVMRGFQVPTSQTPTFRGPMPGAYQQSGLSQLLQLLSTGAAIASPTGRDGTGPSAGGNVIKGVLDIIRRIREGNPDFPPLRPAPNVPPLNTPPSNTTGGGSSPIIDDVSNPIYDIGDDLSDLVSEIYDY